MNLVQIRDDPTRPAKFLTRPDPTADHKQNSEPTWPDPDGDAKS